MATFTNEQITRQANLSPEQAKIEGGIPTADIQNFQKANPNLTFNAQDRAAYFATSPSIKDGQPMDAGVLGSTTSLKVPPATTPSTVSSGLTAQAGAMGEATQSAITQSLKADEAAKKAQVDQSKGIFQGLQQKYLDVVGSRQQEEEQAQIAQKAQATSTARAEAQAASNNIIASQRAQENEIAQLEKNLGGMSASALQGETQRINRQYAHEQADLSLISLVSNAKLNNANFDLTTAQSIVDKKIQNQLEPLKLQMDFAKDFYVENRDAFSKSEDRAFQQVAAEAKQQHDDTQKTLEQIGQIQLEVAKNGAPASVISKIGNAKTLQEAIGATGGFAQSTTEKLQQQKLRLEIAGLNNPSGPTLPQDYSGFLSSRTPEQTAAFNALPANDKSVVAQLVSGDALLTDLVKSRGAQGTKDIQRYIQQATAIDPTFSVNNNKVKYQFLQGWNNPNGKVATTRNAINTSLGHLADFKSSADALDSSSIKKLNSVKNVLTTETGDPRVLQLRTDINALASEIATIYKGGTPTEKEISNWETTLAADFSKKQFQGVSDEINKLLSSKISATNYQYKSTMGYDNPTPLIDPDKVQQLSSVGINPPGTTVMTGPDGQTYHVPNEKVSLFKQNGYK